MRRLVTIGILFAAAAGCAGFRKPGSQPPSREDPLLGPAAPPVSATQLGSNPAVTPNVSGNGTLGQPTSNSQPLAQPTLASPAVLATGAYPPLPGGQDLRIGTPPATAGGNRILPRDQTPAGVLAVVTADPNYGKSTPVPGVMPLDTNGVAAASPGGPAGGLEQALATLNTYRPKWHKLEATGGTWRFSCSIPDQKEPNKSRTYETEAGTAVGAVQMVLDRIRTGT